MIASINGLNNYSVISLAAQRPRMVVDEEEKPKKTRRELIQGRSIQLREYSRSIRNKA